MSIPLHFYDFSCLQVLALYGSTHLYFSLPRSQVFLWSFGAWFNQMTKKVQCSSSTSSQSRHRGGGIKWRYNVGAEFAMHSLSCLCGLVMEWADTYIFNENHLASELSLGGFVLSVASQGVALFWSVESSFRDPWWNYHDGAATSREQAPLWWDYYPNEVRRTCKQELFCVVKKLNFSTFLRGHPCIARSPSRRTITRHSFGSRQSMMLPLN